MSSTVQWTQTNAPHLFISASFLTQVITAETNLCEGDGLDGDSDSSYFLSPLSPFTVFLWTGVIALYAPHHNEP